jgi:hypothetical protein
VRDGRFPDMIKLKCRRKQNQHGACCSHHCIPERGLNQLFLRNHTHKKKLEKSKFRQRDDFVRMGFSVVVVEKIMQPSKRSPNWRG